LNIRRRAIATIAGSADADGAPHVVPCVSLTHKYLEPLEVCAEFKLGGTLRHSTTDTMPSSFRLEIPPIFALELSRSIDT
jgi:hypothetical protein